MPDTPQENEKRTELEDLPPSTDAEQSVKGGFSKTPPPKMECTSGFMSTCYLPETQACDTLTCK